MATNKTTQYTTNPNTIPVDTSTGSQQTLQDALNARATEEDVDSRVLYTPTIASLKAVPISEIVGGQAAKITTTGRSGSFTWEATDQSTNVTNDPQEGVFISPDDDTTGASGAWVREIDLEDPDLVVHVDWFGAIPDGSTSGDGAGTNNYAAIQAAVDFGAVVQLGYGAYRCDSGLVLDNNTTLTGHGKRKSYLDFFNTTDAYAIKTSNFKVVADVNQYCDFYSFTMLGPGRDGATSAIGWASWASTIEDVQIKDFADGITVGSSENTSNLVENNIRFCKIHECTRGIYGVGAAGAVSDIEITQNIINACTDYTVEVANSAGYRILGNNFYNGDRLVYLSAVLNNTVIANNYFGECELCPLLIVGGASGTSLSVVGNVFKYANRNLAATADEDRAIISLLNQAGDGDLDSVIISGNVIRDASGNASFGIFLFGSLNNIEIGANTYEGSWSLSNSIRFPGGDQSDRIFVNEPKLPVSFNLSGAVEYANKNRNVFGTAAPTSGTWEQGDFVWDKSPAAGGTVGWVCVSGGSPGTWKAFGNIEA